METKRPSTSVDRLRWYCANKPVHGSKSIIIREKAFYCGDIETQLKEEIDKWMENEGMRRCAVCGVVAPPHLTENL